MPRLVQATDRAVADAAALLREGAPVAFPTETVYGLGADTFSVEALRHVYALKGRPAANPLIAHVADDGQAARVAAGWDDRCGRLARRFWPGPLTLVVSRRRDVPPEAAAGLPTIAVRSPAHPVARKLLRAFGGPISAPSANRSGHVSPTTARHVADDFRDEAELLILDGGPCTIGVESTVLDLTVDPPAVLRPGAVPVEALRDAVGAVAAPVVAAQSASPGTAPAHYAPRAPAELIARPQLAARLAAAGEPLVVLCLPGGRVEPPHRAIVMPETAEAYAARLYAALREADDLAPPRILIELPPGSRGLWAAVEDRLRRATGRVFRPAP